MIGPKFHVTSSSTSEMGMNAEDHKDYSQWIPIAEGDAETLLIRQLCGFIRQVGDNNGTLVLTDLQCTTERHFTYPILLI